MKYQGFCGQSYSSSSRAVDAERSFNLFPEVINGVGITAKAQLILKRTPGLGLLQTLADSPGRGSFAINGREFVCVGGSFYELLSATTSIKRGSLAYGTSAVQFACNTVQIGLLADGLVYMFNLASNAFAAVTTGMPSAVGSITSIDTYFLFLGVNSNQFVISSPLDGTSVSALNFGSSQEPDNAVAIANLHLYLWIFGQQETIVFQDTGNNSFPFQRVPGSQIEQGCGAAASVAVIDNTLFWLGSDARGPAVVYRADGFLPTRVSTHAVERAMQGYATISDAVASTYQHSGHLFYLLHFPTANACWAYDVATGMWHERGFWNTSTGTYSAPLGRFHSYCFGKHLVADYTSGNIYEQSQAFPTDNGAAIRWLRAAPHIMGPNEGWLYYSYFQLDMQCGGGLPGGADPQVMIRWSDDGGFTFWSYRQASCGATGVYNKRVRVNRCGRARNNNRVYEVSGTDAIPELALIAAYVGVTEGTN
jgi:hypothetical protein